jgi:hypothetical protein
MKRAPQPRRVALAKMKDDLSRYLRLAASEEIVIMGRSKHKEMAECDSGSWWLCCCQRQLRSAVLKTNPSHPRRSCFA